jgi:hypothetical protein
MLSQRAARVSSGQPRDGPWTPRDEYLGDTYLIA